MKRTSSNSQLVDVFCKIFSEWREQQRYGKMQEFRWETWVRSAGLPWNDRLISRENHLKQRDPWPAWIVSSSHQSFFSLFLVVYGLAVPSSFKHPMVSAWSFWLYQPPEEAVLWASICWWIPFLLGRFFVILSGMGHSSGMGQRWEGENILKIHSTARKSWSKIWGCWGPTLQQHSALQTHLTDGGLLWRVQKDLGTVTGLDPHTGGVPSVPSKVVGKMLEVDGIVTFWGTKK